MHFGKYFPRMYIGVTAGLIDGRHHKRLGAAWMLFEWCCMRQTGQGEEGIVCRGVVVTYEGIADEMNCSRANVRNWMRRLVEQGYVRVERDRRGIRIFVKNPKKLRRSKVAHSYRAESVQVGDLRVSNHGHSKPIQPAENKAASEFLLQNKLTKFLKNSNTAADARRASAFTSFLRNFGKEKSIPGQMTPADIVARRKELRLQAERIKRDYPVMGSCSGKVLEMKPQEAKS